MSTKTLRWQRAIALLVTVIVVVALVVPTMAKTPQAPAQASPNGLQGKSYTATYRGQTHGALRDMPIRINAAMTGDGSVKDPRGDFQLPRRITNTSAKGGAVTDRAAASEAPSAYRPSPPPYKKILDDPMPGLWATWHGNNQGDNRTLFLYSFIPPDTNGDTSGDAYTYGYYVQLVNNVMSVWDYSQANVYGAWPRNVLGPIPTNSLFYGTGTECEYSNDGDPIVLYDEQADRWLISQFSLYYYPSGPFFQCIAVSKTGDPTGEYWLYQFMTPLTGLDYDEDPTTAMTYGYKMNDYPKFGIWQNAYYMTVNQFREGDFNWAGAGIYAFDRATMMSGGAASYLYWDPFAAFNCSMGTYYTTESNPWCFLGGMLPADNDGAWAPSGSPGYVMMFEDDAWSTPAYTTGDDLELYYLSVSWPISGVMGWEATLPVNAFDSEVCAGYQRTCIQQLGTTATVDAISDRLMARLQYRNFGPVTGQSMVVNHTVDVSGAYPIGQAGLRWYELKNTGAGWYVAQQGDYAPDTNGRWMASMAMDVQGNMAIGYSISSLAMYPGIRYTGRLVSDPANTLPQGEANARSGSGSQTASAVYGSSYARWGDYSGMNVASGTGCDFLYTQQYYRATAPLEWSTDIVNFGYAGTGQCFDFTSIYPDTVIDTGPSSPTLNPNASFTFHGLTNGGADLAGNSASFDHTYECKIDSGAWYDCSSPDAFTVGSGAHTFYVRAMNMLGMLDPTPASWTWTVLGSYTTTFQSVAMYDGHVIESSETSEIGGLANTFNSYISIGDSAGDKQVRGFLSFNTASLPDTAIVTRITVYMRQNAAIGTSPFVWGGPLLLDIRQPYFGASLNLLASDFQAGADALGVTAFTGPDINNWWNATDNAASLPFVNLTGTTQFRVRFTVPDNDDNSVDWMNFFSGNYISVASRPYLVVEYYIP